MTVANDNLGISPGYVNFGANPGVGGDVQSEVRRLGPAHARALRLGGAKNIEQLPNVTFGGWPFYHIRYETPGGLSLQDDYGTVTADAEHQIVIAWSFVKAAIDRNGADKIINQVMPTFRLL